MMLNLEKGNRTSLSDDWDNVVRRSVNGDDGPTKYSQLQLKPETNFRTGSKYKGQWNTLGMEGSGEYVMFHNVAYNGSMHDGMFHGSGCLKYPNGSRMEGTWREGRMMSHNYYYADDMNYDAVYCQMPDRRYLIEIRHGLQPAGNSYLTNDTEQRHIPEDCYDAGDGFYNPMTKCVTDAADSKKILRIPTQAEHDWIVKHCRKAWDEPAGYRPDLFENWKQESKKDLISSSTTLSDM